MKHRSKIDRISTIVNQELGFAVASNDESAETPSRSQRTIYLAIRNKRAVGLLAVETVRKAFTLKDNNVERSSTPRPCLVGVHKLWVHNSVRKQGIASSMLDAMRDHYIYGMVVPTEQIALSSPTAAGANFARQYLESASILVYDCQSEY